MKTRTFDFHHHIHEQELDEIIQAYREGEVIAFPTETVYGLGADIRNESAIRKIFMAKNRPMDNPLIAHIGRLEDLPSLTETIPPLAATLMESFWPGPLTIILKKHPAISPLATAGLDSIGIRMPDHPVIESILVKGHLILVAPSANQSGSPSPTSAEHVAQDLDGRIWGIIDGGDCEEGIESTIVDLTTPIPMILRPGTITQEDLEEVIGPVVLDPSLLSGEVEVAKAPGMKYRHYAPKARVYMMKEREDVQGIESEMKTHSMDPVHTAIIAFDENISHYDSLICGLKIPVGSRSDLKHSIRNLYRMLRDCDILGMEYLFIERAVEEGLGFSYMNRLKKAASHNHL